MPSLEISARSSAQIEAWALSASIRTASLSFTWSAIVSPWSKDWARRRATTPLPLPWLSALRKPGVTADRSRPLVPVSLDGADSDRTQCLPHGRCPLEECPFSSFRPAPDIHEHVRETTCCTSVPPAATAPRKPNSPDRLPIGSAGQRRRTRRYPAAIAGGLEGRGQAQQAGVVIGATGKGQSHRHADV